MIELAAHFGSALGKQLRAGAPVLLVGGVVLAAAVGAFHLVRYLSR